MLFRLYGVSNSPQGFAEQLQVSTRIKPFYKLGPVQKYSKSVMLYHGVAYPQITIITVINALISGYVLK